MTPSEKRLEAALEFDQKTEALRAWMGELKNLRAVFCLGEKGLEIYRRVVSTEKNPDTLAGFAKVRLIVGFHPSPKTRSKRAVASISKSEPDPGIGRPKGKPLALDLWIATVQDTLLKEQRPC